MAKLSDFIGKADPALVGAADKQADNYGIPRNIFRSLISVESSWNPTAQAGTTSAFGLTQLTNAAAKDMGVNKYDTMENLQGGAAYLSMQYKRLGNWDDALAAYYGGYGGYKKPDSRAYSKKVMQLANTGESMIEDSDIAGAAPSIPGTVLATGGSNSPATGGAIDWLGAHKGLYDNPADKTVEQGQQNGGGIFDFIKEKITDVGFILLGILIFVGAIMLTKPAQEIVVQATKGG